jgi:hypothetical protein
MLKFQNWLGEEVKLKDIPDDMNTAMVFHMLGNIQEFGEMLGLEGKFRLHFGLSDIIDKIKELKARAENGNMG